MPVIKAFAYLRGSGKGQVQGSGFPRQVAAIKAYAKSHDIAIVQVYEEKGISGTVEGMDRPTWAELIGVILSNGINTILVESLGRLASELFVQEYILGDMRQRGIELISVTESDLGSTDPIRVMFRRILGAIHEYEKQMSVLKLRGERKRAPTGSYVGKKPFGFYDGERQILERTKDLRNAGWSFVQIADMLNSDGSKPRSGAKWHPDVIHRLLKSAV